MNWYIWIVAALAYLVFAAWYFNWKGPLGPDEVTRLVAQMEKNSSQSPTDPDIIRKFLETDDGKEFVMLNLVRLHTGEVAHPETGQMTTSPEILQGYFGPFSKALFRKAGHPVFMGRKKGGYIDSWNSAADEDFQVVGAMRYRSRRDLMTLVSDPRFSDSHKFKLAAIDGTISFPMQLRMSAYLRPKIWVPLLLLLLASLGQNFLILFELRK
ncbi:hypothetical protein [Hellea balneolensis]|uniref:hypothetical protein n=1 Tax=Hellea balneolensis TaxID=287478 RepID=UPI00047B945C|nr:hypothetical protein [Hellea balneolensis]